MERTEQDARSALLRYYSSASLGASTRVATLTVGMLGIAYYFRDTPSIQSPLVILFLTAITHTLGRLLWWSSLTTSIIVVPSPIQADGILLKLHESASKGIINKTRFAKQYCRSWPKKDGRILGYICMDIIALILLVFLYRYRFFDIIGSFCSWLFSI